MAMRLRTLFAVLFASFFAFALIYFGVYLMGLNESVLRDGFRVHMVSVPTFFLSDAYNSRLRAIAANELLLNSTIAPIQPFNWTQFEPLDWPPQIPGGEKMERLRKADTADLTAEKMVKEVFPKYANARVVFWKNEQSGYKGQRRLIDQGLFEIGEHLTKNALLIEPDFSKFRDTVTKRFENSDGLYLNQLSSELISEVEPYAEKCPNPQVCQRILYSGMLGGVADGANVYLDQLIERPNLLDFTYFSVAAGTTTGYGDIVPVSRLARVVNAIQILFTYCLLALLTARLVDKFRRADPNKSKP